MSDDGAEYAFFSVLRRGLSRADPAGPARRRPARCGPGARLSAGGSPVTGPALALYGPGDVAGFDAGTVRRTWPAAGAGSAETNYFPLAELSDADLPWRYSPDAAARRPARRRGCASSSWRTARSAARRRPPPGHPLATVTVTSAAGLPDLTQAWAWAHAQVFGGPDAPATDYDPAAVAAILAQAPSRASPGCCARGSCSRGRATRRSSSRPSNGDRLAGLGQPVTGVDRLAPAWQPQARAPVTCRSTTAGASRPATRATSQSLVAKLHPVGQHPGRRLAARAGRQPARRRPGRTGRSWTWTAR